MARPYINVRAIPRTDTTIPSDNLRVTCSGRHVVSPWPAPTRTPATLLILRTLNASVRAITASNPIAEIGDWDYEGGIAVGSNCSFVNPFSAIHTLANSRGPYQSAPPAMVTRSFHDNCQVVDVAKLDAHVASR